MSGTFPAPPASFAWIRPPVAFLPGVREWLLLAVLAFALFGRTAFTRPGRLAARWLARPRAGALRPPPSGWRWVVAHRGVLAWCLLAIGLVVWTLMVWSVVRVRAAG